MDIFSINLVAAEQSEAAMGLLGDQQELTGFERFVLGEPVGLSESRDRLVVAARDARQRFARLNFMETRFFLCVRNTNDGSCGSVGHV